ncbi:hypothetical protein PACTADRAFT_75944 [Pachysolen tannophilus NRRL Y-2460]|uniref:TauD/TfdA-like domain-containing protein n=1 Tax=Pachysolen tannophilus NRRL Y-2460 TaxID=669874 RepID=A0A1E4TUR1_PACTA|nr:hypothetical protein PACTADRAFT_75944 [Pachysolen tannophilus NRRL Y-2460]
MVTIHSIETKTKNQPVKLVAPEPSIDDVVNQLHSLKVQKLKDNRVPLPAAAKKRMEKYGIDISRGYPEIPNDSDIPIYVQDATKIRDSEVPFVDRGKFADPEKKALFSAVKEVKHLSKHLGTELVGVQLASLNEKQLDELALLIAERIVVFFRDQDLSPQRQVELGHYFGNVEVHAQQPRVPGLAGTTVIWPDYMIQNGVKYRFKQSRTATGVWHSDLSHEFQPAGITHLHNDTIPEVGGDTLWSSGYAAYDKLSSALQQFLDGKEAVYVSIHQYLDRDDPFGGKKSIERVHPLVRTHPVTGWKSLYVNRQMTKSIVGLEPAESKLILEYLFDVYEKNLDIQVRFNWKSKSGLGTSALWDNRVSQHCAVWDYENDEPRHGTRVTSLAELPIFDPNSKSQREALGLSLN